jgi:hypothetical protein
MPDGNTFGNISAANDWLENGGWKTGRLARALSALDRYRMLGLKSAAGMRCGMAVRLTGGLLRGSRAGRAGY